MMRTILALLFALFLTVGPVAAQDAGSNKMAKKAPPAATATAGLVDINSASVADLKALPGIGDAYSAAIIKGRPYKNKTQLVSRRIVPQATYDKIRDKIIAKQ